MTHIEFNLHCARVACANYVGYVDHIETALVALSLVGITGPRALSLAVRGLLPRAERQLSAMKADLSYADTTMRREIENVERLAGVIRNLKALADEHDPQPEPTLCELAGEIAGMRSAA